jgi:hypothetical protein
MINLVVLAEEASARIVAESLVSKLGLHDRVICLEHQGKSDLEKSFPRKIKGWRGPQPPRFIIMRDNDGADCFARKEHLLELVPREAAARVKIRLVLQELESWYLGDLDAVAHAGLIDGASLARHKNHRRYRDPDAIRHAKEEFRTRVAEAGQIELARRIAPHLDLNINRSHSFHIFINALRWGWEMAA